MIKLKVEILSPAGSFDALKAAVQSGADAVYFGAGSFNARRNAKNFSDDNAIYEGVGYCRARGVKAYAAINTLIGDTEQRDALNLAKVFYDAGIDAVIVADLGFASLLRQAAPKMRLHASTQMSVHNLEGVKALSKLGFSRVVLARELSGEDIKVITGKSPVEIEVFVHGALCMCYSGQCYMSAFLGGRSGNRGLCAQPCRLIYDISGDRGHLLSLKDMCLGDYIDELAGLGVNSLKIEGRMKRAEYVAMVTSAYAGAVKGGGFSPDMKETLSKVFSRGGFTDGYFTGKTGAGMFGYRDESGKQDSREYEDILSSVTREGHEYPRIPVYFDFKAKKDEPVCLSVKDKDGYTASASGAMPQIAINRALDEETVKGALSKTKDTPYFAEDFNIEIGENIALPVKEINALRRQVLDEISKIRKTIPQRDFKMPDLLIEKSEKNSGYEIQCKFYNIDGLPENTGELPDKMWLPLEKVFEYSKKIKELLSFGKNVGLAMPRIAHDTEIPKIKEFLTEAKKIGIKDILTGDLGLSKIANSSGFDIHGDFGLNIYNSHSLLTLKNEGFKTATLSFELSLNQINDMQKPIPCGIIAYGRMPLMIFRNCIMGDRVENGLCKRGVKLNDRKNENFILLNEFGCRNTLLNAKTTYLADRSEIKSVDVSFIRLDFYTETPQECGEIINNYRQFAGKREDITRGLYYKGVL